MSRAARACALLVVLACWTFGVSPAEAQYRHRIVLLSRESADADTVTAELRARLRGELAAIGFDVLIVAPPEGVDLRDAIESAARELSPSAVIGMREIAGTAQDQGGVEVWISDRLSGRTFVERSVPGEVRSRQIGLLAVEVSEAFKARLSSLRIEPTPAPAEKPAPDSVPSESVNAPPAEAPPRASPSGYELLVGAGFGVIQQLADPVSAWFPSLQVGLKTPSSAIRLGARASAGLTPGKSEFVQAGGRARATQGFGFVQGLLYVAPISRLELALSLGGGIYTVGVEGEAAAPDAAREERTWSAAASFGLGAWIETSDALLVALEAQGLSPWSSTVVRIKGEEVASFGFPAGLFSASLIARY